jgi:site-specific DNA-methyltransferase (adenine-specific)
MMENKIKLTCEDCMNLMARYPDKHFDLAIVDPPYGGSCSYTYIPSKKNESAFSIATTNFEIYAIKASASKGVWGDNKVQHGWDRNTAEKWDDPPPLDWFRELFRVSKNQIIWGGNNFPLPPTKCFIVWDKKIAENFSMAMCECAWTNFNTNAKIFRGTSTGTAKTPRIHPTQKPVKLYKWLLQNYAKPGWKILDTHLGSGSIAIACEDMGFDLTACEIDKDYYESTARRLEEYRKQQKFCFEEKE